MNSQQVQEIISKVESMRAEYALTEAYDQPRHDCTAYLYDDGTIVEVVGNMVPCSVYFQKDLGCGIPLTVAGYSQQHDSALPSSFNWTDATESQKEEALDLWKGNYDRVPEGYEGDCTVVLEDGTWIGYDQDFYVISREWAYGEEFQDEEFEAIAQSIRDMLLSPLTV